MIKTTVYWILGFCFVWAIVALDFQAQAAQEPRQEAQMLETVVVTAGRIEERARNVSRFVTVIPQEEIRKNQYQNMAGLLRNYGVQIDHHAANEAQGQVTIRGMRTMVPTEGGQGLVVILVDGRRIGTENIGMVPMVNIERIEILRGPASVQYGASAIGGVVNVITKRGTEELSASIQGGAGSWDTYQGQGSLAWAQGPIDFSGGISYRTVGDYRIGGNRKYPNTGTGDKVAYSFNVGYTFLEEHRIGATVLGVDAVRLGNPWDISDPNPIDSLDLSNYSADFVYEGGDKDIGLSWKGRYFFGADEYINAGRYPGFTPNRVRNIADYQGSQGQVTFQKNILTLTGGVDWLRYDGTKKMDNNTYNNTYKYDDLGVFALATVGLFNDRLFLNGGVRQNSYRLESEGNKKNLNKVIPSFGVAWHTTDWLTLKGNYGEAYRIPNALECLGFQGGGFGPTDPNPNLKPERARGYDVGFEIKHKSLRIGLSYFETQYKNKITKVDDGGWPVTSQYINADGKIWLKGFEGNASYDLGEALDWPVRLRPYVNFTALTERRNSEKHPLFGRKVNNVSDVELGYGLNFAYPEFGFEVDLSFTYMGRQDIEDQIFGSPTWGQAIRVGGKTTADLLLSQRIHSSDKGTFSAFGEIRNIGDVRYALIHGYPQPGRSFFVGLRYDY